MKFLYPLYCVYVCFIAIPLIAVSTVVTSILTLIVSPVFPNNKISYLPPICWGRFCCYILFINVKMSGLENLDRKQSYVFTSNHQSVFDILAVYGWLPYIFKWMMKMELQKVPFLGAACQAAGHIFVDRSNPIAAKHSMEKAADQLKHGVSVVIFPEGTRTKTGELGRFKRGAFLLALELQLPIIPITLSGSFERIKGHLIFPGTIKMIIHQPVDVTVYRMDESSTLSQNTQEIIRSGL